MLSTTQRVALAIFLLLQNSLLLGIARYYSFHNPKEEGIPFALALGAVTILGCFWKLGFTNRVIMLIFGGIVPVCGTLLALPQGDASSKLYLAISILTIFAINETYMKMANQSDTFFTLFLMVSGTAALGLSGSRPEIAVMNNPLFLFYAFGLAIYLLTKDSK